MQRVKLRVWSVGTVVLALALGTSLTNAAVVSSQRTGAQTTPLPGAAIFSRNCAVCHGTGASGKMGPPLNVLPPELANLPAEVIAQELTGLVRSGIPGAMPRFLPEQLSDSDVLEVTKYLLGQNGSVPSPSLYEALPGIQAAQAGPGRTYFAETAHSIGGEFRTFWRRYGGLRVFGLPLTEEYNGVSPEDGKVYRMQMFERARMELHTDLPPGQQVQLALLGTEEIRLRSHFTLREDGEGAGQPASTSTQSVPTRSFWQLPATTTR